MSNDNWRGISRLFTNCNELDETLDDPNGDGHYVVGHPKTTRLQSRLEELYGMPTIVTTRGMTAIHSTLSALRPSHQNPGLACSKLIYPGTKLLLKELEAKGVFTVYWFDPTNADSIQHLPVLLYFTETIGNSPTMPVADIPKMMDIVVQRGGTLVVDNTATPQFSIKPHPNAVVLSSLTKYGQPDDAWTGGRISATEQMLSQITSSRLYTDATMPHQAAEYYQGQIIDIKSRYTDHTANTELAAEECRRHESVNVVWYPGFPTHPQNNLVHSLHSGLAGGFFYIALKGGAKAAKSLCNSLASNHDNDWHLGPSFGCSDWRLFPFTSKKATAFVDAQGIVRIAPGRQSPEKNLRDLHAALKACN